MVSFLTTLNQQYHKVMSIVMVRNYVIIAWKSLYKNMVYSMINSLGLAIGITAFLLISLYVRYELGYDQHLNNKENIYRVQLNRYDKGKLGTQWAAGCAGIGPALIVDFPEVEAYVKLYRKNGIIQYKEKIFREEKKLLCHIRLLQGIFNQLN